MTAMRAVRVSRPGAIDLVEVERPRPGADEALVAVAAVGICGSDVELLDGTRPGLPRLRRVRPLQGGPHQLVPE